MTKVDDVFVKLGRDSYLSKIDMTKGYWQIPITEEDRKYTAFITHDGLYQFTRMPFGLVNSGATFNKLMRKLLCSLNAVDHYVDYVLVNSKSWNHHINVLRETFRRIRAANLTVIPSKSLFGFPSLEYVGQKVGNGELSPKVDKVSQIQDAPRPTTKKQVRSFLGLTGYYRAYIQSYADKALPLTDLTKKGKPNKVQWTCREENAFQTLKNALCSQPVLKMPDMSKEFILQTDASENALGAVLLQEYDGENFPVAYASKKLLVRETRYSVIEKECLAIVWAIKKFHMYLYGHPFTLQTDHQPLGYLNHAVYSNGRLMRWSLFLQSYEIRIQVIKGSQNVGADFMSRKHCNEV